MVDEFFESEYNPALRVIDKTETETASELPKIDGLEGPASLDEMVEIIFWYHHFIYVKLMRAVRGALGKTPQMREDFPKDSDGSAKLALIAIDRSMAAWGFLDDCFPAHRQQIFSIIQHLEGLRRRVENVFPQARNFVRPGFDE